MRPAWDISPPPRIAQDVIRLALGASPVLFSLAHPVGAAVAFARDKWALIPREARGIACKQYFRRQLPGPPQ
jgi:hypothetical protein